MSLNDERYTKWYDTDIGRIKHEIMTLMQFNQTFDAKYIYNRTKEQFSEIRYLVCATTLRKFYEDGNMEGYSRKLEPIARGHDVVERYVYYKDNK